MTTPGLQADAVAYYSWREVKYGQGWYHPQDPRISHAKDLLRRLKSGRNQPQSRINRVEAYLLALKLSE